MKYIISAFILVLLCLSGSVAHAQKSPALASPEGNAEVMATKFVRDVANTATCAIEFPKQIYKTSKQGGLVKGVVIGPLKGIGMTIVRVVSGASEAALFFLSVTGSFEPYFEPAYAWQGWSE